MNMYIIHADPTHSQRTHRLCSVYYRYLYIYIIRHGVSTKSAIVKLIINTTCIYSARTVCIIYQIYIILCAYVVQQTVYIWTHIYMKLLFIILNNVPAPPTPRDENCLTIFPPIYTRIIYIMMYGSSVADNNYNHRELY